MLTVISTALGVMLGMVLTTVLAWVIITHPKVMEWYMDRIMDAGNKFVEKQVSKFEETGES